MAESLERCFSRALLKHFPSEDCDTDEEFHVSREEKERKDKKRNRSNKHSGPESLIRATEQVQRKRNFPGGKGNGPAEEENHRRANGPGYPLSQLPQQHPRGMYHPGQQVSTGHSYLVWLFSLFFQKLFYTFNCFLLLLFFLKTTFSTVSPPSSWSSRTSHVWPKNDDGSSFHIPGSYSQTWRPQLEPHVSKL